MELAEIKEALLKKCEENGGYVTDLDIIFIFPKPNLPSIYSINEPDFVAKFNAIKTLIKGRKSVTRGLSTQAKNNLKKLIERGYSWNDLKCAIEAMYYPDGMKKSWAERTGNDNPNHLLRENNFERYLNIYHNGKSDHKENRTIDDKRKEAINRLIGG